MDGVLGTAAPLLIGALWGVGDGMLNTELNAVVGLMFEDAKVIYTYGMKTMPWSHLLVCNFFLIIFQTYTLMYLRWMLKFGNMENAGICLCTVQGLGMWRRCRHLLPEPAHRATGHAHLDDCVPCHLIQRVPVPHNCCREVIIAIGCRILRQICYPLPNQTGARPCIFVGVTSRALPRFVFTSGMEGKCLIHPIWVDTMFCCAIGFRYCWSYSRSTEWGSRQLGFMDVLLLHWAGRSCRSCVRQQNGFVY